MIPKVETRISFNWRAKMTIVRPPLRCPGFNEHITIYIPEKQHPEESGCFLFKIACVILCICLWTLSSVAHGFKMPSLTLLHCEDVLHWSKDFPATTPFPIPQKGSLDSVTPWKDSSVWFGVWPSWLRCKTSRCIGPTDPIAIPSRKCPDSSTIEITQRQHVRLC